MLKHIIMAIRAIPIILKVFIVFNVFILIF